MHKTNDIMKMYHHIKMNNPDIDRQMVEKFIDEMPDEAYKVFSEYEHITSLSFYKRAVAALEWKNHKGSGDKWRMEKIIELSGIDFNTKKYTIYDYAYWVNMLYSDHLDLVDASVYLEWAKDDLEDIDYEGDPSTRAYEHACKKLNIH